MKQNKFVVYKRTNTVNGKIYIGITSRTPEERMKDKYKSCTYINNAIKKYGKEAFVTEILEKDLTKEEACQKEIELIALYDARNPEKGYNISLGGSAPMYGRHHTKEAKEKMSKERQGEKNNFYGKRHNREKMPHNIQIICLNNLKIYPSMSLAAEDENVFTTERNIQHCIKNQQLIAGKNINNEDLFWMVYDSTKSLEYYKQEFFRRKNVKENWRFSTKEIINIETKEIYANAEEASKKLNCNKSMVHCACNGHKNVCKDNFLMYKDEYDILSPQEVKEKLTELKCKTQGNSVVCLNTGEFFQSLVSAGEKYNLFNGDVIADCCNKISQYAGKHPITKDFLKWRYYEEYKNMSKEEILEEIRRPVKGHQPVCCINTKTTYRDAQTAADVFGLFRTGITKCCQGKYKSCGKNHLGEKLIWKYVDKYDCGFIEENS